MGLPTCLPLIVLRVPQWTIMHRSLFPLLVGLVVESFNRVGASVAVRNERRNPLLRSCQSLLERACTPAGSARVLQ